MCGGYVEEEFDSTIWCIRWTENSTNKQMGFASALEASIFLGRLRKDSQTDTSISNIQLLRD